VLGQLIHSSYLKSLAIQINETLQMNGTLNISTLTTQYDLPGDYLQHVNLNDRLKIHSRWFHENEELNFPSMKKLINK